MDSVNKVFGYKPDGRAMLFAVPTGESLPAGWSDDIMVISDPALRTGEKVSEAAGKSILHPVPVSPRAEAIMIEDMEIKTAVQETELRYDENNNPVEPPVVRRRGRPPGSKNNA